MPSHRISCHCDPIKTSCMRLPATADIVTLLRGGCRDPTLHPRDEGRSRSRSPPARILPDNYYDDDDEEEEEEEEEELSRRNMRLQHSLAKPNKAKVATHRA